LHIICTRTLTAVAIAMRTHATTSQRSGSARLGPETLLSVKLYPDVRYIGTSEERLDALKGTARPDSPMHRVEFHSPACRPPAAWGH
jgi:hypothetical protein